MFGTSVNTDHYGKPKRSYQFKEVGTYKHPNDLEAVKDLKSGNFVKCPRDAKFKKDLYITGIKDRPCACKTLKDKIEKNLELIQSYLDQEIFDKEPKDIKIIQSLQIEINKEKKVYYISTVFKVTQQ